ncbi:tetratricopeptide repeat protein [Roseomonas terrae]|uniref:Tetratricopeptide repeat protein n=1 Tax=Neoroseomonas terrae TaxID=424799 RepID=A0ABS5EI05_9PROT|nr:tetratricopeptide repeat protein [Neoroseomonas terrae]MBR0650666.1 tetratricopeptide repeat protein [Neoroseomonas terrae]
MPDIFDEVAEDLRAERARKLWARLSTPLFTVLLLVLVGIGGWQGWRWYENRQQAAAATAFMAAHRATEAQGADLTAMASRFEAIAGENPGGYRTIALLRAAALKAEAGDRDGALAVYDRVANDTSIDPLYRSLASLLWALRSLDTAEPAALTARLAPLTGADSPFSASARELSALATLKAGQRAEARTAFQALAADQAAPQSIRERAGRIAEELAS